jgi:hypothetical protein
MAVGTVADNATVADSNLLNRSTNAAGSSPDSSHMNSARVEVVGLGCTNGEKPSKNEVEASSLRFLYGVLAAMA